MAKLLESMVGVLVGGLVKFNEPLS